MEKKTRYIAITAAAVVACLSAVFVCVLYSVLPAEPKPPEKFTTNIDLVHKTINDSGINQNAGETSSLIGSIFEQGQKWLSKNFNVWRFYQNIANPYSRYIVLNPGLRKEEVAALLSKELNWNAGEKEGFLAMDEKIDKRNMEGYYNPGEYLIPASTKPQTAYQTIMKKFDEDVESRYATSTAEIINLDVALKIGSIIERESNGTRDMRLISGIIWNRIFKDMNLEMDATLQYAKGTEVNGWWPKLESEDKYIDSPYNTYQNKGLPPTPISNVSIAAINAALNPKKTVCVFYLHDKRGNIHCSVTYKDHLANIKKYYGK